MSLAVLPPPPVPADTPSAWARLRRGRAWVHADPDWEAVAGPGWLETIMAADVSDRFHAKQGRSIGRWALERDGRRLVVYLKRHHVLPRWRGVLAALFPGRAWSPGREEWEHLGWAKANGLPVPRAVAVGELVGPWGRLEGFLAVEELTDMLPLHEAIPLALERLPVADFARWKRGLAAELARLARLLHDRRAYHQDLYLCHFYVPAADTGRVPDGWPGRVWMIDFHRLAFPRLWRQGAARVKDLGQLLFSTFGVPGVTDRDRALFWRRYRDAARPTLVGRMIRGAAVAKAERYRKHNARKAARAEG